MQSRWWSALWGVGSNGLCRHSRPGLLCRADHDTKLVCCADRLLVVGKLVAATFCCNADSGELLQLCGVQQ